ncbi:Glyoxalase/Bleomycin resistance protein/Dihydroxybiphenyl dioxygenase [Diplogelasinospora grovesii]|uniref:Glyoxalase/Bleomycin resistance protein/Dihydroxybiphenyl dioxygenase n=1 Tax=Diplogelasinospora grovesii TaxID=303347 RepID=A0AAN6N1F1_9PEZI|nr:Glyoxalase/Bleomycin resistance protein/Dihydroxybiphenyl dioxygenase [Diplogelasinospora grovesii]
MTIDHTGIRVPADKHGKVIAWYEAALAPLGYKIAMEFMNGNVIGFGDQPFKVDWWVTGTQETVNTSHHAFTAKDRATVDAFHTAAVEAGGKCNGPPGIRAHYHPNYYGAFVLDPAGNNIEVVCHAPDI